MIDREKGAVLGADHLGRLLVIAAQVDGVKLASGRAHATADAAVGIDDAHAAAKAAGRLLFDLLFRERAARVSATFSVNGMLRWLSIFGT